MDVNVHLIYFTFLYVITFTANNILTKTIQEICPGYKKGPRLHVQDLVGSWMTAYIQPQAIDCFVFHVRATTELEREQYVGKYGSLNNSVQWSECFLQVETREGKHFLQGNGTLSGLLENIIIYEDKPGQYQLQNASADQWMVFGRRGSEVLITRDCFGESAAAFARAPYWPTFQELSAIFHRSGTAIQTHRHTLCKPKGICSKESYVAPPTTPTSSMNQKGNTQEVKRPLDL